MKSLNLVLLTLLLVPSAVFAHDHPATHGMLVVGHDHVYLSHLPMFHSPHDYQVIAEAALPADAQTIYVKDMASHPNQKIYTLVPEAFVLPDMIAHPKPFRADLYRGHFERGGVPIAQGIVVQLTHVIYSKKFDPAATHPATLQYFAFGVPGGEQFIAHVITAKPDFDQVLQVNGLSGALPKVIEFADAPAESPLSETSDRKEIYLETGDLAD